ncbi:MAG: hypothetical protein ABSG85_19105 [Spirochaetia bacterium]|jgi:hypothetical protein
MGTKVGLWIDHRQAIVVGITDKGEETGLIISAVEKQLRRSRNSRSVGAYEPLNCEHSWCGIHTDIWSW